MEIGSEFWLGDLTELEGISSNEIPNWLDKYGEVLLTSSGRGAISLILQQFIPINKSVLLPSYICDSVILPFIKHGYKCYFYEVDEKLSPVIDDFENYKSIGVFVHMGYYGFNTNSGLSSVLKYFQKQSTIIIEDVTHSLFSDFNNFEENDFYVGSIRKWLGIPSGGFLASSKKTIRKPLLSNSDFSLLRKAALINKGMYMKSNDENLKSLFLSQFSAAEIILDNDMNPYCMDSRSRVLLDSFNKNELVNKRRENYKFLLEGLQDISYLETLFKHLTMNDCPMFYPILIKKNRNNIRKKLIDERIYCPVHWPIPDPIKGTEGFNTLEIYNNILSIPCDQRYGVDDMDRMISVLKTI